MKPDQPYYILAHHNRDIIVHIPSGTKVNVFLLAENQYIPKTGELVLFGNHEGFYLAFETVKWADKSIDIVTEAIQWYLWRKNIRHMEIGTKDPR